MKRLLKKDFTEEEWEFLRNIAETDGAEIHESDWALAQALVVKGAIRLSSPRGPDRAFRRATLITMPRVEGL